MALKDFAGKIAVISSGGTGMGRELALALAAEGCSGATAGALLELHGFGA
jgi:NAD(P)-dependent dehydrogenase (short-subunit alcohol dehydrogenase family)